MEYRRITEYPARALAVSGWRRIPDTLRVQALAGGGKRRQLAGAGRSPSLYELGAGLAQRVPGVNVGPLVSDVAGRLQVHEVGVGLADGELALHP